MKSFQKRNKKLFVKAVWLGFVFAICFSRILNVLADGLNFTNELDKAYEADKQTNFEQSIVHYTQALQIQTNRPHSAIAYVGRGLFLSRQGDFASGMADSEKAIQLDSNCFTAYNNLAWMLATAAEAKLRDGKKAVEFATRACELSKWKEPYCLGTLAAALAETGKFDEAIKWEEKCIQMGLPNEKDMVQARHELELFKQGKPYHADK